MSCAREEVNSSSEECNLQIIYRPKEEECNFSNPTSLLNTVLQSLRVVYCFLLTMDGVTHNEPLLETK